MINPSDLQLSSLPWVPLDSTAGFPAKPGIYFAIDSQGVVQYIGRSSDVRGRWKSHHRYEDLNRIGGVRIAYLFIDIVELLPSVEASLIEWFDPPLNVMLKKQPSAQVDSSSDLETNPRKQPKAKVQMYGQKKTERIQVLFTAQGLEQLDGVAKSLSLSRSDLTEQMVRSFYTMDDASIYAFLDCGKRRIDP